MKYTLLSLCFLCCSYCIAQNLVPNPSFEDTIWCPGGGLILGAKYWNDIQESPDYFHECSMYYQFSVPKNVFGYQWPSTGKAYVGMAVYSTIDNYREAIGVYLIEPLIIGQKYFVSFNACLAFNPNQGANVAINKLGMLFSVVNYLSSYPPQNNYCQVYSTQIISDTSQWTTIRGSFIADSTYQFISITNFFKYGDTDTMRFYNNNWYQSYYFVDDVCVSTDSVYCAMWTSVPEAVLTGNNITTYPNPVWNVINITNIPFDCKELQVISSDGKMVQSITSWNDFKTSIDVSLLADGMYSLVIRRQKSIQYKKFIKSRL
jgi:hypothetical protein